MQTNYRPIVFGVSEPDVCVCVGLCSSEGVGKAVHPENDNKVSLKAQVKLFLPVLI